MKPDKNIEKSHSIIAQFIMDGLSFMIIFSIIYHGFLKISAFIIDKNDGAIVLAAHTALLYCV